MDFGPWTDLCMSTEKPKGSLIATEEGVSIRMDSGLGLIYAGMREKTHSASTQLKGTGTFEGTVTDLINLLEVWETS